MKRDVIRSSIFGCLNESRIWRIEWILILTLFLSFFPFFGRFLISALILFSSSSSFSVPDLDKWLNCIQVFNKEGVYVRQIGVKGTSPGHFRSPEGIAVDFKGNIYVCDTCNDRVQVCIWISFHALAAIPFQLMYFALHFREGGRRACLSDQQRKK